jgi:hypothetical protein
MKKLLIILFLFISVCLYSQNVDTLSYANYNFQEQVSAFYDKLNQRIIITSVPENNKYNIELFDITGLSIVKTEVIPINRKIELSMFLKQGVYIVVFGNKNFSITKKFRVY